MEVKPEEIKEIKTIGSLNNEDVKMLVLKGGLYMAVGKKTKNGKKDQLLTAGSHQGIIAHQISKEYGQDFHPAMFKSESEQMPNVENKSSYLPVGLYNSGVELFAINKNNNLDFIIYKYGLTICKYETEVEDNNLIIKNYSFKREYADIKAPEVAKAIAKAMNEKVKELNLNGVKKENER